jgi:hypothetical protein
VKYDTSTIAFATPTTASSAIATTSLDVAASAMNGIPHPAMPTASHRPKPELRTSSDVASDPNTAPAPKPAVSRPTPESRSPSSWNATTTENTAKHPRVNVCRQPRIVSSRTSGLRPMTATPSIAPRTARVRTASTSRGGAS